jgi:hypothetical protein
MQFQVTRKCKAEHMHAPPSTHLFWVLLLLVPLLLPALLLLGQAGDQ